ncbi:MAG TPA: type I restriction endonuclease [Candidatus Omnitrophota bacterium]|nr:type I restriction endonuclease [Candidatus Omnitrophota bacterium]
MAFNENTRVKIPAILHLCRLGYQYLSLQNFKRDEGTNIATDIFKESLVRINPEIEESEIKKALEDVCLALDNEDLGQAFYNKLTATSGLKLIDFKNFDKNSFHVVTELTYKNGDDEFRPDITVFVNGLPLVFIEVKKPNNPEGILAERDRINVRFKNKKFRRFINATQLLIYSNNMEYDTESVVPIQGAFYSTTSFGDAVFNCFRDEEQFNLEQILLAENDSIEDCILKDNNLSAIKHSPEFLTNKNPSNPTNRLLTSLLSKDRLRLFLKYAIAYVNTEGGALEKHVMRYPQFFATKAIESKLDKGVKKGIIWHTQGSGKTALAFYSTHYLTDYFNKKSVVPKFYFIVDRLDLLIQASREFTSRGLVVHTVNSKEDLARDFSLQTAVHNLAGKREITVVNIQKFDDKTELPRPSSYDINVQRVYFLDEVHRSYNPTGSFLANLFSSDRNAVLIGLTGTPLIGIDSRSRDIFGDYIHKYYYNASIADGYTLKLIREGIETNYKIELERALKEVEILQGALDRRAVYAHERFVAPMLDYIVTDFLKSRTTYGDSTIGGMVVCDSAEQAKKLYEMFNTKYELAVRDEQPRYLAAAEPAAKYGAKSILLNRLKAALILHDVGDTDSRKAEVTDFKEGKTDLLFVYNMLLTGFDAKRLKKLYLGRIVKDHNLLQTLTRVNRPYKEFKYGYVVDFADIRKEFDATNKAYFDELQAELGDEMKTYSDLFKSKEEIESEITQIKDKLFQYDLNNAEIFSQQISEIQDRALVLDIKKALESAKNLYNIIRLYGHQELLDRIDFKKLSMLYSEVSRHLNLLNLKESVQNSTDTTNLLNVALENVYFMFRKVSEEELVIADHLKDLLRKTREALANNFDPRDPHFVSLYDELKRLFEKKNLDEVTQDEMKRNIESLQSIFDRVNELNRRNNLLKAKYENDTKYARLHKRILERGNISKSESEIQSALLGIKHQADEKVLLNNRLLNNESYFSNFMMGLVISEFDQTRIRLEPESARFLNNYFVKEYLDEYQGTPSW